MGQDARALEPFAQQDRDRRRRAHASLRQPEGLFLEHPPELLRLEMALAPAGREQASDRAGHGPHARPGGSEPAPGILKIGKERLRASAVRFGHLCERLDRLARHPARTVLAIVTELCDPTV